MSRVNLVLLAACGGAWLLLHQVIGQQNRALVFEDHSSTQRTPLLRIHAAGRVSPSLRVLLIHGLSASKSAMKQMAGELARWGCDCYVIDLPGHGDSTEGFSLQAATSAVDESVRALVAESSSGNSGSTPLVLIGHSLGARIALGSAQRHPQIAAVIALSPATEFLGSDKMVPLLIVTGEFDFPFVRRGAAFLYEQATGEHLPPLDKPAEWQRLADSTRLVVLPWTDHSQTLFRPGSLREIQSWLGQINPEISRVHFAPRAYVGRIVVRLLYCILSFLAWFPLVALVTDLLAIQTEKSNGLPISRDKGFKFVWIYALAASLATLLLLWVNPWRHLGLMGGGYLAGLLCATGVLGLIFLRQEWKRGNDKWQALLCGLLAWLILVGFSLPRITAEFAYLGLNFSRLWRFPWIALSVLPFFVLDEYICRRFLHGLSAIRVVLFHLSTRLVLALVVLLGFFVLRTGQFLVVLLLPGLLATSLLCWSMATWIHRNTASTLASSFFAALAIGWFFSVFFAQV